MFYYCSKRGFSFFYSDVDEDVESIFFYLEATRDFIGFEIFFEMLSIFHLASFFLDGCRKLARERENWSFYQKNNYSVIEEIEIIREEFINWEERD